MAGEMPNDVLFAVTILLGFLLLIAMTHYEGSGDAAVNEARALTGLVATVDGIKDTAMREDIQHDAVCYTRAAISVDWYAGQTSAEGGEVGGSSRGAYLLNELSRAISSAVRAGYDYDEMMAADTAIRTYRAERLHQATPFSLAPWVMSGLSVALLIIMAAMLLAREYLWVQYYIVLSTAFILAFMLILIGAYSRPFAGQDPLPVVSPVLMEEARASMDTCVNGNPRVMGPCATTSPPGPRLGLLRPAPQVLCEEALHRTVGAHTVLGLGEAVALVVGHDVLHVHAALRERLHDLVALMLGNSRVVGALDHHERGDDVVHP